MVYKEIILTLMIFWDFSLHLVEILHIENYHLLYPIFPLFSVINYDLFWTSYWFIAFLIILSILLNKIKYKNGIY